MTLTLPETNVAPKNRPSQKETSIPTIHFQVLLPLVSGRVYANTNTRCIENILNKHQSNSILFAFSPKSHPGCPFRFFFKRSTVDINNFKAPHIDNFVCWSSAIPRSNRRRNSSTDLASIYPSREYSDIYLFI